MSIFNQYPYINMQDLNLDYILNEIKSMYNDVTNFVSINAIKYANPIQWNITSQYEKNTIVIDPQTGTAYISVAAVPAGVALTRGEYWTVVFDLGSFVTRAAKNFTTRYEEDTTLTATFSSSAGDWLVWGDTLYVANVNITVGDSYVVDSNISRITVEEVKNTVLQLISDNYDALVAMIGDLNNLTTTDKTNIVAAINELVSGLSDEVQSRTDAVLSIQNELDEIVSASVKRYGASGSNNIFNGSVLGNVLTISNHDFEVNNGIILLNAGELPVFSAPSNFAASVIGATGSLTHTYSVACVSFNGAMSEAVSVTLANCPITPTADNYVEISWTKYDRNLVDNYAIYRDGALIGFCNPASVATGSTITFDDFYCDAIVAPVNISQTPPITKIRPWLDCVVLTVNGDEITVNKSADVSGQVVVYHNDRAAIQNALSDKNAYFPDGIYNIFNYKQQDAYRFNLLIYKNSEIYGNGSKSIIRNINGYMSLFMFCNAVNAGLSNEPDSNVNIHDIVLDGGIPDGFMQNPKGQFYGDTGLLFISANGVNVPENYTVKNCIFKNSCASTCVFSLAHYVTVDNCHFENALGGPSVNNNCYGFKFTNNFIMNTGDDAISANAIGIGYYNSNGVIANNIIFNSGSRGIVVQGSNINVIGNTIYLCASTGILAWNLDGGGNLNHINIASNNIFGAGRLNAGVNGYLLPTGSIGVGGISGIMIASYELVDVSALVQQISIVNNTIDYSGDYSIRLYNQGAMYMNRIMVVNNNLGDGTVSVEVINANQNSLIANNI